MKTKLLFLLLLLSTALSSATAENEIIAFRLTSQNGLPDNYIRKIEQDSLGYLYMRGRYGIYKYDGYHFRELSKEESKLVPKSKVSAGNVPGASFKDNLGNPMTLTADGDLVYVDLRTRQTFKIHIVAPSRYRLTNRLKCIVITDKRGLVWISTNGDGLFIYNKATGGLRHLTKDSPDQLLPTNYFVHMMEDRDGNIWLCSEYVGIVRMQVHQQRYSVINLDAGGDDKGNDARMLTRLGDGTILISNLTGRMWVSDDNLNTMRGFDTGSNYISACLDNRHRLWLGSRENGVMVDGKRYGKKRTDCIVMDNKGRMWTCGLKGCLKLVSIDGGRYTERRFLQEIDDLDPRVIIVDHRGDLWLGTKKGLFVIDPDKILKNPRSYTKVCDYEVMCIYETSDKQLWFGTVGHGAFYGDNSKTVARKFDNIAKREGLANNVVQFVSEDDRQNICIGTERGITILNRKTKKAFNLFFTNDMLRNICNERCVVRLPGGRMAFGTYDGIVVTSPSALLHTGNKHHNLVMTGFNVNGMPLADFVKYDGDISQLKEITLAHDQNSIEASFSNFDYGDNGLTTYQCRLDGYDNDWVVLGDGNTAIYKKLKPGNYTLHVRSFDVNGSVEEAQMSVKIKVRSPWWVSWWAILIYVAIAATAGFFLYRHLLEIYRLRRDIAVERKLTDYKLRFFTNISHEFRTPLTLIEVAMEKIKNSKAIPADMRQPVSNMQRSVERMMRLINQLLEFRKMQNNKLSLSLQKTDIVPMLRDIFMNFHDIAESRNINYVFTTSEKSIVLYVDRGHIDKIVYNLLSNAFKYTPKNGSVELRVKREESNSKGSNGGNDSSLITHHSSLKIIVADTGIGVAKDKQAELFSRYATGKVSPDSIGIGLNLTQELVRVHHGDISYRNNTPQGSVFTVVLPMDESAYQPDDFLKTNTALSDDNQPVQSQQEESYREMLPEPMNDKTVLIVEDNVDVAEMLNRELGRYFTIRIANDGEEALQTLRSKQPDVDLVVSDVMMPRMNGFELTKAIRADKELQHLPVVLLTALDSEAKQERGMNVGADAYVTKPFSLRLLIAKCCSLLEQRERLKAAYATMPQQIRETLPEVIREEKDKKFLDQLDMYIQTHIDDQTMTVDTIAESFRMGRTSFYNKVRNLKGITPNEYLREARLNAAAQILREEDANVSEVCYRVGFGNPQYFATSFKKKYGMTPKEYQKGKKSKE